MPQPIHPVEDKRSALDVESVRAVFPALHQQVHGKDLVYLDSAATALKPQAVIDAVTGIYARDCANIHRGVHLLSQRATEAYEGTREKVRRFIGAGSTREVIYVRGTTEAINLVAQTHGRLHVGEGDEIVVTGLEHHSNIVPWQMLAEEKRARLTVVPIGDDGDVPVAAFEAAIGARTRIVAMAHVSNALGTVLPVAEVSEIAHRHGAVVVVDGAQAVPHLSVDVQALGCDFYAFSGHKLYGPTGTGILWGRESLLAAMPPWQGGGDMIRAVTFEKTTYADLPQKFEAGTPDIAGVVGLGAAIDWIEGIDLGAIAAHEAALLDYATERLNQVPGLRILGTAPKKTGVLAFVIDGLHPHDIGTIVDMEGVAIRTGHHCAQPVMERYGVPATSRASLAVYNTREDVDRLVAALRKVREVMGG